MDLDRIVIIQDASDHWGEGELKFNCSEMNDSQALHELLCQVDPGEEYTVVFKKILVKG